MIYFVIKLIILIKQFCIKIKEDHVTAFGSQATFFIILSFFPFVMFLLTLTRFLPISQSSITSLLTSIVPSELNSFVVTIVDDLYSKATGTVISLSVITAIWSASRGILAITYGLNKVYGIHESRNYFVLRFISAIYTLLFATILIVSLIILVFGKSIYKTAVNNNSFLYNVFDLIIDVRVVIGLLLFFLFFLAIYAIVPNRRTKLRSEAVGALFASLGWIAASYVFSIYIDKFGNFSYMYGSLAGIIIAMLWLYVCMNIVFIGAEINYFLAKIKANNWKIPV